MAEEVTGPEGAGHDEIIDFFTPSEIAKSARAQGVALLVLGFIVLILGVTQIYVAVQSDRAHDDICKSQNAVLGVVSSILTSAQIKTDTNPKIPAASKKASDLFVASAIVKLTAARC